MRSRILVASSLLLLASCSFGDSGPTPSTAPASPDASLTFDYGFAGDLKLTGEPTCAVHKHFQLLVEGTVDGHPYSISSTLPSFPTTSLVTIDGKKPTLFVVADANNPAVSWNTGTGAAGSVTINTDGVDGSVEAFLVKADSAPPDTRTPLHVSGSWVCRLVG